MCWLGHFIAFVSHVYFQRMGIGCCDWVPVNSGLVNATLSSLECLLTSCIHVYRLVWACFLLKPQLLQWTWSVTCGTLQWLYWGSVFFVTPYDYSQIAQTIKNNNVLWWTGLVKWGREIQRHASLSCWASLPPPWRILGCWRWSQGLQVCML